jgi:Flp pilus assembly protein TadD
VVACYQMGLCLQTLGDLEGAIHEWQKALKLSKEPHSFSQISQVLATAYVANNQDLQSAIKVLQLAIQQDKHNPEPLAKLAELYSELGDFEASIQAYKDLLRFFPDNADIYSYLGYLLWQQDYNDEARVAYEQALALQPNNPIVHNNLGVILFDCFGQIRLAQEHFGKALDQDKAYTMAQFNLGRVLQQQGEREQAISAFIATQKLNASQNVLEPEELETRLLELYEV